MANPSEQIDLAGMTLIVKDVKVNAAQTGQAGQDIAGNSASPTFTTVTADAFVIDAASDITIPSAAVADAGTGVGSAGHTGGAVGAKVIPITIGSTTYYIPLCSTNA